MKLISWNVNGIRATLGKGFGSFVAEYQPDILCLQETKAYQHQVPLPEELNGYHGYWNSAEKAGYSGVAVFSKKEPLRVSLGMQGEEHNKEGRILNVEYDDFILVNVYTPNAQDELRRLPYRMQWDIAFRDHCSQLATQKPVIICGDLNVAHQEIDLARPKENRFSAGFSDEERAGMHALLAQDFIDTFRFLHPDATEQYSWWSYRMKARERNVGWRIDYFLASTSLQNRITKAEILQHIHGSDHCPVSLTLS